MTRWARGNAKEALQASTWHDLKRKSEDNSSAAACQDRRPGNPSRPVDQKDLKKICLFCRKPGHKMNACPDNLHSGSHQSICFKCGSSDHSLSGCKVKLPTGQLPFAVCFICKQNGHLASKCPDNPRGLYPLGGGCKFCGSVEHLVRDCPDRSTSSATPGKAEGKRLTLAVFDDASHRSADAIDLSEESDHEVELPRPKRPRVVKF